MLRATVLVVLALGVVLLLTYQSLLSTAGRFLRLEEPLQPADAILVTYATDRPGVQHAADLYFAGYAPLLILSNARVDMPGVAVHDLSELFRAELLSLGVPDEAMVAIRVRPTSTKEEMQAMQEVFTQRRVKSVILVTMSPRMRRSLLTLRRDLKPYGIRLLPSAFEPPDFNLDRWWETRQGISAVALNEYPRLLYYLLRGRF